MTFIELVITGAIWAGLFFMLGYIAGQETDHL